MQRVLAAGNFRRNTASFENRRFCKFTIHPGEVCSVEVSMGKSESLAVFTSEATPGLNRLMGHQSSKMTCLVGFEGAPEVNTGTEIQTLHKMPPVFGHKQYVSRGHRHLHVSRSPALVVAKATGVLQNESYIQGTTILHSRSKF